MVNPLVLVICGVSGAGKTTIGRLLATQTGRVFLDADDFHPPVNVAKMRRGEPLTDADRAPWLAALRAQVDRALETSQPTVLACSALKLSYRAALGIDQHHVVSVFLEGAPALIAGRIAGRQHAFMPPGLLHSQFAALEPPADGIRVSIDQPPTAMVQAIISAAGIVSAARLHPAQGAADAPHSQ